MRSLICYLPSLDKVSEYLKNIIDEFGHKLGDANADYVFLTSNVWSPSAIDNALAKVIYIQNKPDALDVYYIKNRQQVYLFKHYLLTENSDDNQQEALEDLVVFLSRVELEGIIDETMICPNFIWQSQHESGDNLDLLEHNIASNNYLSVIELFEQQVLKTPGLCAVSFNQEQINYIDLDKKSSQLAAFIYDQYPELIQESNDSKRLIGLSLKRGIDKVIAMLAVLKLRAAFVPIDPMSVEGRASYILANTKLKLVLTTSNLDHLNQVFSTHAVKTINLDDESVSKNNDNFVRPKPEKHDLAYIIFTSGTTGQPKGVMIEQRGLINLVQTQAKYFNIQPTDKVLQFASYTFDAAISEIFVTVCSGAAIYICSDWERYDNMLLTKYIKSNAITVATLPPALLKNMSYVEFPVLRLLIIAGESCDRQTIDRWQKNRQLINAYGPTEATVCASLHVYNETDPKDIIGMALDNVQLYVLDNELNRVEAGTVGELYIGGEGVARGYLNNEELTQEKFIPNKFATNDDKARGYTKLYKTGDLVKLLDDGNLMYIGRNDFQVKLRGYRIELGEIESAVENHTNVRHAVVLLDKKIDDGTLVVYYVSEDKEDISGLKDYLVTKLPEYMIPSFYIRVHSIPLTVNGKIDHNKLLDLNVKFKDKLPEYTPPEGEKEECLASIWRTFFKLDKISRDSNFFELGGHSVILMRLLSEIRNKYPCHLVPKDVFANPQLCKLASLLETRLSNRDTIDYPIVKTGLQRALASKVQQNYWMIDRMDSDSTKAFTIPVFFNINEGVDPDLLARAVKKLGWRHEILRSRFEIVGNDIFQIIADEEIVLEVQTDSVDNLNNWLESQSNTVFDLSVGHLFRASLYLIKDTSNSVLSLTHHHIIADGFSIEILIKDLSTLYAQENGKNIELPTIEYSYIDFSIWHAGWLKHSGAYAKNIEYWKGHIPKNPTFTISPDKPRPARLSYAGDVVSFTIDEKLTQKIISYANNNQITEFTVLLSSFYIMLAKYTGEHQVNAGIPFANRHYKGVGDIVGCFINTLPFEYNINYNLSNLQLIKDIGNKLFDMQSYHDVYYPDIIHELQIKTSQAFAPLYQVMFVSELFEEASNPILKDISRNNYLSKTAKVDFSSYFLVIDNKLVFNFEYNTNLFEKSTITKLAKYFENILLQITDNITIKEINLLGDDTKILSQSRGYDAEITNKSLLELFALQVNLNPKNLALVFDDTKYTYQELDIYSDNLAYFISKQYKTLHSSSLTPETPIAFYLERSAIVIPTILAILKLGCVYVPIDSKTPRERLNYILNDTKSPILITNSLVVGDLLDSDTATAVVFVDNAENIPVNSSKSNEHNLELKSIKANAPAYVLYTSGTTGNPKGCAVSNANLINLFFYSQKIYNITVNDRIAQYVSFAFDTFCIDWSLALLGGASLYIVPEDFKQDTKLLVNYLNKNKITYIDIPTAVFHILDEVDLTSLSYLKNMKIGGEKLLHINADNVSFNIYNAYGPTEATVESLIYQIHDVKQQNIPIGRPIDNVQAYILDSELNLVPEGVIGELYIGGAGVASGYLNNEILTAEKFITNKFATKADIGKGYTRLYKTGDMVKWLPDGNMEYIGRNDSQIKLRGYRIELGDIESVIKMHPKIKQCIVLLDNSVGDGVLAAYYISENNVEMPELKNYLALELPEYMMPSFLVKVDRFPLTINGKVDRQQLLELNSSLIKVDDTFAAPIGEIEIALADIWKKLLKLTQVSRMGDFFALGGHSVLLMRLLSEIRNKFSCDLVPKDVFNNPQLLQMAKKIEELSFDKISEKEYYIEQTNLCRAKASHLQQGLFLIHNYDLVSAKAYTTPLFLNIKGELNIECLNKAIDNLIARHAILRTKFVLETTALYQVVVNVGAKLEVTYANDASELESWLNLQANTIFDLSQATLFRPNLLVLPKKNNYVLSLTHHHILADGYAIGILTNDLFTLYARELGAKVKLDNVPYSYIDFSQWHEKWLKQDSVHRAYQNYWNSHLPKNPNFTLPSDRQRPSFLTYTGEVFDFELNEELTTRIKNYTKQHKVTEFAILLGSFYILLAKYSGKHTVNTGIPFLNRNYPGAEHVVGCFVNALPLEYTIDFNANSFDLINDLNNRVSQMQEFQGTNILKLLQDNNLSVSSGYNSLFQILFVMQDEFPINTHGMGLTIEGIDYFNSTSKYDLTFQVRHKKDKLKINIEYNTTIFSAYFKENITGSFVTLLNQVLHHDSHSKILIRDIGFLSPQMYKKVVYSWNNTRHMYPENKTIHGIFEEQAAKNPKDIALIYGDNSLTYEELNVKSNKLANYLINNYNVKPRDLVALCLNRSEYIPIAIFAILKIGAAYIPIDPANLDSKISYIVDDTATKLILTNLTYKERFNNIINKKTYISVDFIDSKESFSIIDGCTSKNLYNRQDSKDLMCVVYTSGTSGKSKGVMLEHRSIINRIFWGYQYFPYSLSEVCCFKTSINFVDHIAEILSPLLYGKPLVVFGEYVSLTKFDMYEFINRIESYKVTRLTLVPALLDAMLDIENLSKLSSIKYYFISGETFSYGIIEKFTQKLPQATLINIYGSSEVSADATYKVLAGPDPFISNFVKGLSLVHQTYQNKRLTNKINANDYESPQDFCFSESIALPMDFVEYFKKYIDEMILPNIIDCSNPKFIGHMVSVLPHFNYEINNIMGILNQNVVKIETSNALTHLEIATISMVHKMFYDESEEFYKKCNADKNLFCGVCVSGGTVANLTALWAARNNSLPHNGSFTGVDKAGLHAGLAYYGYSKAVILVSKLAHYSFEKASSILGIGKENIIEVELEDNFKANIKDLRDKVINLKKNRVKIIAIVGIAGTTETGTIDNLDLMADVAKEYDIHFHVDAAFGGAFILSRQLQTALKGIERADSVTVCGHKQLFLPMGISLCLFKDPTFARNIFTTADYQSTLDSFDLGKASPEGSRPALSMCLHASLCILGKPGYNQILDICFENTRFLSNVLSQLECFELILLPELNIVNYRYLPKQLRYKEKPLDETTNILLNDINRLIQITQFKNGRTFVSKTLIPYIKNNSEEIVVFRAILSNPLSKKQDIIDVLIDQIQIANQITGDNDENIINYLNQLLNADNIFMQLIGKPMSNTHAYVLNDQLQPLPAGMVGELYIGGVGLARGYLNQSDLTAQKFIVNPFQTDQEKGWGVNNRLYKTGDNARWLASGELEFIGRNDSQIKVRGMGVELCEIENILNLTLNIKQSIVIAQEHKNIDGTLTSDKYLVAFYVSKDNKNISKFKKNLSNKLPDYMMPAYFVKVESIPLTINGKVDRQKLATFFSLPDQVTKIILPQNSRQETILKIFMKTLRLNSQISTDSNFFDLGGNSIQAAKAVNAINEKFKTTLMIGIIYHYPTVEAIEQHLNVGYYPLVDLNQLVTYSTTMFLFHSARGSAEVYFRFANMFKDVRVIGVESYNIYNDDSIRDFKELVSYYVESIIKAYPDLPCYNLGGWSFGGILAYEAALQLREKYSKNCQVILFDTFSVDMVKILKQTQLNYDYNVDQNYGVADQYLAKSKLVGQISEEMYLSYQCRASSLEVYLIKATDYTGLQDKNIINLLEKYHDNGWEKYIKNLHKYSVPANHESLFDERVLIASHAIIQDILFKG